MTTQNQPIPQTVLSQPAEYVVGWLKANGALYSSDDPPTLLWVKDSVPWRLPQDIDDVDGDICILARAEAKPLEVHRYAYRGGEGLYVGIPAGGKQVPWAGRWAYLLDGSQFRIVPAAYNGVLVVGGHAPLQGTATCSCGEEPDYILPSVIAGTLCCDNVELSLSPNEVAEVIAVWVYVALLRKPTKPLLVLTGPPGSGKTSMARALVKLLEGPEANVIVLPRGPDDFAVVASRHRFLALDNVDDCPRWLFDILAASATGAAAENRRLYTDDKVASLSPGRCAFILTSMDVPFNRPDVADRVLVLAMRPLDGFLPEGKVQEEVEAMRQAFWFGLLHDLNHLVAEEQGQETSAQAFRMADYAAVGSLVWRERTEFILEALARAQASLALQDDPVTAALIDMAKEKGYISGKASQLKAHIIELLGEIPPEARTAKRLGDHMRRIAKAAKSFGLGITWESDPHANAYIYTVEWLGEPAGQPAADSASTSPA